MACTVSFVITQTTTDHPPSYFSRYCPAFPPVMKRISTLSPSDVYACFSRKSPTPPQTVALRPNRVSLMMANTWQWTLKHSTQAWYTTIGSVRFIIGAFRIIYIEPLAAGDWKRHACNSTIRVRHGSVSIASPQMSEVATVPPEFSLEKFRHK